MTSPSTLKAIRLTHHYIGVFLAPAILFFAITGALQTFSLHETTRGSSYVPPAILVHLSQLHKKATLTIPQRKPAPTPKPEAPKPDAPKPDAPKPDAPKPDAPKPDAPKPPAQSYHWPMKIFFAIVALGLVTSTLTGLYMAWKYTRTKSLVVAIFLAGILLPAVLLLF